ncbi:MAG: GNAT family N-acetyltransferase [Pseudomonadota bacterium]
MTATRTVTATITYLEMTQPPKRRFPAPMLSGDAGPLALLRAEKPPLHFYRYLYGTIGKAHTWVERAYLNDTELEALIHKPGIHIMVLYASGIPAGYYELDESYGDVVDLCYMGLMPDFVGRGIGKFLLSEALHHAWSIEPERVRVNTNTLDHPSALPLYQRMGFSPYAQEERSFEVREG